jgi:aerobic carbon-monoxide dehydrogenase large subunit
VALVQTQESPAVSDPTDGAIGSSPLRKEDPSLLTGAARFVGDLDRPGMVHAFVVRSPYAHARLVRVNAEAARALPNVVIVVTGDDLPPATPPILMRMFSRPGLERFLQPPLARGVVRYSGEPVAVVVADSPYGAEDAAELVEVEYEELTPLVSADAALAPGAALLHEDAATNLAASFTVEHGDLDAAFAAAAVVVEERLYVQRHAAVPLETRGLVAELDELTDTLVVLGAAKIPHVNKRILARMLGRPEERIRLVELHVGGGFGARGEFYPEDFLIPFCALRLGRPVSWIEDREEHLRACNHSREQIHEIALAVDREGRFLALRDRLLNDTGAYVRTHGLVVPGMTAALLPGPYRWPAYRCEVNQVVTSKTPAGTYRAPGRYEANFARERLIDMAARRLGLDPVELRRRNLVTPDEMPYATGTHTDGHPVVYDSGDYPLLLDKGLERFGWEELCRWRGRDAGPGRRRGVGLAFFVEKSGIARWEYARVELTSSGKTHVYSGGASVGQGLETALAQVCASTLGVPYDDVSVFHGDTATVPDGLGAFGSRAATLGGSAVLVGATRLRERLLELASSELEIAPADLDVEGGSVVARGFPSREVSLVRLFERARAGNALRAGEQPGLTEEAYFTAEDMTFPYGLHVAAVEVDVETGAVHIERYGVAYDLGRAINPVLVEGQVVGGVAQGVGGALLEELVYDPDGQLVAGSFMDYLLPTASEVPAVEVLITEDAPTPRNPLGAKGAGEGGAAAVGAALANAVADALGVEVTRLPLAPERVLALVAEGGNP